MVVELEMVELVMVTASLRIQVTEVLDWVAPAPKSQVPVATSPAK